MAISYFSAEGLKKLQDKYEAQLQTAVQDAMSSLLDRFKLVVQRMVTQLRDTEVDEKKPRIYDSLLGNARDLIDMIPAMNIANDTQLEYFRQQLHNTIDGIETEDLKLDDFLRRRVRDTASDILDKWSW